MHSNEFIRGATFWWSGSAILRDQAGKQIDMEVIAVTAQARTPDGTLIADLVVTYGDGAIVVRYPGDTSAWPLGRAEIDIWFTLVDGSKAPTDKTSFEIVKGVTQP